MTTNKTTSKTNKMNRHIKSRWVKALRSGKYKQTREILMKTRSDGQVGYCCLGVLCDLAVRAGVIDSVPDDENPPYVVYEWAGMAYEDTLDSGIMTRRRKFHTSLSSLNDNACYTFDQIADVIQKQF